MPAVAYFARIDQAEVYVALRLRESKQYWLATVEVSTPVTIKFGYRIDRLSAKEKVFEIALADLHICRGQRTSDGMNENKAIFCRRYLSLSEGKFLPEGKNRKAFILSGSLSKSSIFVLLLKEPLYPALSRAPW